MNHCKHCHRRLTEPEDLPGICWACQFKLKRKQPRKGYDTEKEWSNAVGYGSFQYCPYPNGVEPNHKRNAS